MCPKVNLVRITHRSQMCPGETKGTTEGRRGGGDGAGTLSYGKFKEQLGGEDVLMRPKQFNAECMVYNRGSLPWLHIRVIGELLENSYPGLTPKDSNSIVLG